MISRLLDVKHHLTAMLDELTWDSLTATQWTPLEAIQELIEPFAHHTKITGVENSTTIVTIFPFLKELNLHLEVVCILYTVQVCNYSGSVTINYY